MYIMKKAHISSAAAFQIWLSVNKPEPVCRMRGTGPRHPTISAPRQPCEGTILDQGVPRQPRMINTTQSREETSWPNSNQIANSES